MAIIDTTTLIGQLLEQMTVNITGSLFISLFFIMMFFIMLCVAFSIPVELSAAVILPFIIISAFATSQILPTLGILIIYLAIIFVKRLWFT